MDAMLDYGGAVRAFAQTFRAARDFNNPQILMHHFHSSVDFLAERHRNFGVAFLLECHAAFVDKIS